jgi:predicted enzyme related to lactoylglutathione lyase
MNDLKANIIGVEFYYENLSKAKKFYSEVLGLNLTEAKDDHHAKFDTDGGFICLEKKGAENYPSKDKAVLFIEVSDIKTAIKKIGAKHVVKYDPKCNKPWAVIHDTEGYNIVLLQSLSK